MTQEEKRICAERIFDEIGLIDDRFISEAETSYVPASRRTGWRRFLIAAVSVTLVVSIGVGILVTGMLSAQKNHSPEADMDAVDTQIGGLTQDGSTSAQRTLSARLEAIKRKTADMKVNEADIELFGNTPKVIWKYSEEDSYRVCNITEWQVKTLVQKLSENKGERVDSKAVSDKLDGVWIATGDGRVISPYLEQTAGNTGYGEIFEYVPEYEPSEDFSEYLCDVIS